MKHKITRLLLFSLFIGLTEILSAQHAKHQSGPMLGYVEQMEVGLWYQTNSDATVQIKYWKKSEPKKVFETDKVSTSKENYFIAKFIVADLFYGTEYVYDVYVDSKKATFSYPTEFKTQDLWQWRKPAPDFTFAVGSCFYVNDPEFDRPGRGYGGDTKIMESIADKKPDLMLWTGDNIYYREPDFSSKARMDYRNRQARSLKDVQRLLAVSANYATWDDHDFGPNNSDRSYPYKDEALELFNAYWFNPHAGSDGNKGVYFSFLYNDIDFIMTDDRYHRAPNKLEDSTKAFFGETQMQWIKDRLLNSYAPFKVVIVGNQAINMNNPYEGFQEFKKEQTELLDFIKQHKIEGVVFFSGDRHHTELLKLEQEGMYPLYEFTNSPLTSGYNANLRDELKNPLRVEGTLVNTEHNFGLVKISGERNSRLMTIQTYSAKGDLLWQYEISEKELKFKN
ncbi:alkaline phosphatase family protein [bacterium]|nr:MAG: alkaline phosphatase family protein [bacterium]